MNPIDIVNSVITVIANQNLLVRIVLIIFLSIYGLFAVIVAYQIRLLTAYYDQTTFSPVLRTIGIIHVLATFILLLITVLSL